MPIAIVMSENGTIPAVLAQSTAEALISALRCLEAAPALETAQDARNWLLRLPEPSGWYDTPEEAHARLDQMRQGPDFAPDEIKAARKALGLSQAEFASALGYGGNDNTRKGITFDMEKGKRRMNPEACRQLRRLLAAGGLRNATDNE